MGLDDGGWSYGDGNAMGFESVGALNDSDCCCWGLEMALDLAQI